MTRGGERDGEPGDGGGVGEFTKSLNCRRHALHETQACHSALTLTGLAEASE